MKDKILSQIKGKDVSNVKALVLDSCDSTSIIRLTDEFHNLENLSMRNVGLTNLNGLPNLPNLKKLDLSDNKIFGDLKCISDKCPKLKSLILKGNVIDNIEDLAPLSHLSDLKYLELQTCPVSSSNNYRREVFALLPNLQFLDGLDQNAEAEKSVKEDSSDLADDSIEEEEAREQHGSSEEEYYDCDCDVESIRDDNLQKIPTDEESERNENSPSDEDESDVESDEKYLRGQNRKLEEQDDDEE